MKRYRVIAIALILLLMGMAVPMAMAAPAAQDQTGTVVHEGEVVNNDVIVFDGDLEIRQGGIVNGDVVVFNGDAQLEGMVNGDLILFNGDLVANEGASISGDCVLLNGNNLGVVPGNCTTVQSLNFDWAALAAVAPQWFNAPPTMPAIPSVPTVPPIPTVPGVPNDDSYEYGYEYAPESSGGYAYGTERGPVDVGPSGFFYGVGRIVAVLMSSVLLGFLGLLVAAVAPDNLRQIAAVARRKPVMSGAAGGLTAVAVPSLIVLLVPLSIVLTFVCIGLLGFPIIILLAIGLIVAVFVGWIAVGTVLGERLFNRRKDMRLTTTAALGNGALMLGVGMLGLLPILGFLAGVLVFVFSAIGLGAVALTQFGMKPYPRRTEPTAAPPEDPDKVDEVLLTLAPDEIGDIAAES